MMIGWPFTADRIVVEVTRLVACARRLRRARIGEKSRNLLNRALRALNKDPHLVAGAATALSPSRGLKSLSIQRGLHSGSAWASALSGPGEG